jgi:hypothetical protein
MVVNFRVREINRGVRKLAWTPTLIKKNTVKNSKIINLVFFFNLNILSRVFSNILNILCMA